MEKFCGAIVFLSVYQLAGMLNYHDWPVLMAHHLDSMCLSFGNTTGVRLC